MKLGFWTLGMPKWTNEELARRAADLGYDGIDLRAGSKSGRPRATNTQVSLTMDAAERAATAATFADAGVEIVSLLVYNASPLAGTAAVWQEFQTEVGEHLELATDLNVSRVRFQIEGLPEGVSSWDAYLGRIWEVLSEELDQHPSTTVVIENHPDRANARQLFETARRIGDPRIGIEFSPEHSIVMQELDFLDLIDEFADHVRQICLADRKLVQEELARFDGRYYYIRYESCWNGDGVVPTAQILERLARHGFDDYISLKWEKSDTIGPHLPPGEEALAHFPGFMRSFPAFLATPASVRD